MSSLNLVYIFITKQNVQRYTIGDAIILKYIILEILIEVELYYLVLSNLVFGSFKLLFIISIIHVLCLTE